MKYLCPIWWLFYFYSSNYMILVSVSHTSPTPFTIHSQPLVHLNYLNIIFHRQLGQSAPVMCKNHNVATPVTVLVADEWRWRVGRITLTRQNPSIQRKTCSTATLSTKNFTWMTLRLNSGLYSDRPGTNCLSHAFFLYIWYTICTLIVSELVIPYTPYRSLSLTKEQT